MAKQKGVFCLEAADWWNDLKKASTVAPMLDLLDEYEDYKVNHIHRDVATPEEFEFYLSKWAQAKYQRYKILYLSFHGRPGELVLGELGRKENVIDLDWVEQRLGGKCKGRVIHFGACSTIKLHGLRLNRFLDRTQALAVSGYTREIDWLVSTAFDLLVFNYMQGQTFTVAGIRAVEKRIFGEVGGLARSLHFRMVIRA